MIYLDEYEVDCSEFDELKNSEDFKILKDDILTLGSRKRADIYMLNFYGPVTVDDLIEINEEDYYSNLNSLYKEDEVIWSVPIGAVRGDIVIFMCANSSGTKASSVCTEIKNRVGIFNDIFDFASAEKNVYKKYSGTIVAWGVLSDFPEEREDNSKLGWARVNINDKFDVPVPYSSVKDLFKLNVYGSSTKLNKEEWNNIQKVIKTYNPNFKTD